MESKLWVLGVGGRSGPMSIKSSSIMERSKVRPRGGGTGLSTLLPSSSWSWRTDGRRKQSLDLFFFFFEKVHIERNA